MSGHDVSQTQLFQAEEQFRMCRLQVHNWGTFDKYHDVPIAEKGFLFVGRSGSGKTTLLDAFSTLLVPPKWVNFNAAAQETERRGRDRSLASYVRGAWAEQQDNGSGEVATQYLRKGPVWSALAVSFAGTGGEALTLVQLFWLRGTATGDGDVRRHYMIFERAFDLRELDDFDLDLRKLKAAFPDAFHAKQFNAYCDRFCRLLSIDNEMALRLLHRTQSAKNLGDLNAFLREFMLDRPETFDVAERLVNEFGELNEAHQAVVTARNQVAVLAPARTAYADLRKRSAERSAIEALQESVLPYRERRRRGLLEELARRLDTEREALAAEIRAQERIAADHAQTIRTLEEQHRSLGGGQMEDLTARHEELRDRRDEALRKQGEAQGHAKALGHALPTDPAAFAELTASARGELEGWPERNDAIEERNISLKIKLKEADAAFQEVRKEAESLKRRHGNIPLHMIELREGIAAELGLSEEALPFVGELLGVREEEQAWRGVIERVLHGFALSLLVDGRHYAALSNHVNQTHLGQRLVYYRTGDVRGGTPPLPLDRLTRKLEIKPGPHREWLEDQLVRRFDYTCVESMQAFRNAERAVTKEGQVKHGGGRHEKDDRCRVDDRERYVLGFDNAEKRRLLEERGRGLAAKLAEIDADLRALREEREVLQQRALACQSLANMQWREIDAAGLMESMRGIEEQLDIIRRGSAALREAEAELDKRRALAARAAKNLQKLQVRDERTKDQARDARKLLDKLPPDAELLPEQVSGLEERLSATGEVVALENLDRLAGDVDRSLGKELRAVETECSRLERAIEGRFAEFKREWPMEAGDMDATLASAEDYLARLKRLEEDGLPAHEERFFDLLQNQSNQNLAELNSRIQEARREIRSRLEQVNEGLATAPFNPGTHLRIDVSDRNLAEVRDFRSETREALSHAFTGDRDAAELRFRALSKLVARLAGEDAEDKRWQRTVLDVRLHVEFIARELDGEDRVVEVYRSGAGKSGGQRQKLATTCLAAALRYQLSGVERAMPVYAPVVLDEAFDKADNEFTTLAMNVFASFGFQMIVATPLKSVMTLEPFIGGACFIDISERRHSSVLHIAYDEASARLELPDRVHGHASSAAS